MKMTKRDRILIAVIAAVAVLGGFYWFAIKPAKSELSAQKDQLAQIEEENNSLQRHPRPRRGADEGQRQAGDRPPAAGQGHAGGRRDPERGGPDPASGRPVERGADLHQDQRLQRLRRDPRAPSSRCKITGKFFDVDDFLYRLHRQVSVNEKDQPVVSGRLFATTSVDLTLDQGEADSTGGVKADDQVVGTVKVLAFSSVPSGAAAPAASATTAPAAGSPIAATTPPTTTGATTTGATTTAAPATSAPGAAQATATPSSGGAQ